MPSADAIAWQSGANDILNEIYEQMKSLSDTISNTVSSWVENAKQTLSSFVSGTQQTLGDAWDKVTAAPEWIKNQIWNAISSVFSWFFDSIKYVAGIAINAITAPLAAAGNAITNAFQTASDSLSFLGPLAPLAMVIIAGLVIFVLVFIGKRIVGVVL